jgi:hypothetical protein
MTFFGDRLIVRGDDPEAIVRRYAGSLGDSTEEAGPAAPGLGLEWKIRWRVAPEGELHFGIDENTSAGFVYWTSETRDVATEMTSRAAEHLPVYTRDELLERWYDTEDPSEAARWLLMVALGAHYTFEPRVLNVIKDGLARPETEVRSAAVYATTYSPTRFYRPVLRRVAQEDEDAEVRDLASRILSIYDQLGIGEP